MRDVIKMTNKEIEDEIDYISLYLDNSGNLTWQEQYRLEQLYNELDRRKELKEKREKEN